MNNCLIMGSGRSGTSMMGGIMHDAGYYMGEDLYPGRDSNPKGFFENAEINGLNERILSHYDNKWDKVKNKIFNKATIYAPSEGQRWLISLKEEINVNYIDNILKKRIQNAISKQSFCYKDPRFSYTLPVWEKFLPSDTKFIVMFRSPGVTINSILRECANTGYLHNLQIDKDKAEESWINIYKHVKKSYKRKPEKFLFMHYEQVYKGSGLEKLSSFLSAEIKVDFVEKGLKRSKDLEQVSLESKMLYDWLCEKASYEC